MIGSPVEVPTLDLDDEAWETVRFRTFRLLRRNPSFWLGGCIVGAMVVIAIFAPWLSPHDPDHLFPDGISFIGAPLGHTSKFLLGTDQDGRDVLSRLIYGARLSLSISILANLLAVIVGVSLGAAAGWWRGVAETVIMRFTDIMIAFPALLLATALVAIKGPSLTIIIIVIGMVSWTGLCRITYGQVLSYREREWIDAARALGVPDGRILVRHILPHLVGPIIVYATLGVGVTVVFEGSLEYLGLGVPSPTASWGSMIQTGSAYGLQYYWLILYPCVALFMTVLGFNLLGDALRDALDPNSLGQR